MIHPKHRAAVLTLLLAGCSSLRHPVPMETIPAAAAQRDRYQVWAGGKARVLIALRSNSDSLSGVPSWMPPACDSCRVTFARSAIDSVRVSAFDPNKTLLLGIVLTPIIYVMIAFRGMGDPNY